ncbi:hypothetical protein BDN71DRAFT_1507407 [Pleurotus eryngii]|uniref:Uncharacterized protein n=1 Tax=Pleurotus eryngii TaxID=5323 RepID=A0A9P5ZYP7_PLEER|nr:hypothetical protein BDN71DRAFT_1507407 [Pleurotus eryngii]
MHLYDSDNGLVPIGASTPCSALSCAQPALPKRVHHRDRLHAFDHSAGLNRQTTTPKDKAVQSNSVVSESSKAISAATRTTASGSERTRVLVATKQSLFPVNKEIGVLPSSVGASASPSIYQHADVSFSALCCFAFNLNVEALCTRRQVHAQNLARELSKLGLVSPLQRSLSRL